jgi:putrescine transport system substrate-binding protein
MERIKPEVAGNKTIFIDSTVAATMVPPGKFTNEGREAMANAYTAFKKGK